MCLAVPAKIVNLEGDFAKADFGGIIRNISVQLVPDIKKGEYCLVHAGFAVEKITEKYANEAKGYIKEMFKDPGYE